MKRDPDDYADRMEDAKDAGYSNSEARSLAGSGLRRGKFADVELDRKPASQAVLDIGFAHDRTTGKEDWLTPPEIVRALGPFDLDPCSPLPRPWDTAQRHYTIADNGLLKPWGGRVWMNPPYGNETERWMRRLANHGNGIALIFARTETKSFFPWVWDYATALFWIKGRVNFFTKEGKRGGTAGAPSVLVAYGQYNAERLKKCGFEGHYSTNVGVAGTESGGAH